MQLFEYLPMIFDGLFRQALQSVRVWDIAAGENFSIFLADASNNTCSMYQLGESLKWVKISHLASFS